MRWGILMVALFVSAPAYAQVISRGDPAPPSDSDILRLRAEAAEAELRLHAAVIQRQSAEIKYWHQWCQGEHACE
jgi:hypothetical protein